jgi:hypothetical protein
MGREQQERRQGQARPTDGRQLLNERDEYNNPGSSERLTHTVLFFTALALSVIPYFVILFPLLISEMANTLSIVFHCGYCGQNYSDQTELYTHIGLCKPTVQAIYPNAEINITRDEDGHLACYCSSPLCVRLYRSETDLLAHIEFDQGHYTGPLDEDDYNPVSPW